MGRGHHSHGGGRSRAGVAGRRGITFAHRVGDTDGWQREKGEEEEAFHRRFLWWKRVSEQSVPALPDDPDLWVYIFGNQNRVGVEGMWVRTLWTAQRSVQKDIDGGARILNKMEFGRER